MTSPNMIELNDIVMAKVAQPRNGIDMDCVKSYSDDMVFGHVFPPIVVFEEMSCDIAHVYFLADGWHRVRATMLIEGRTTIDADVREGGLRDAILYSTSANAGHGLQRSSDDKRRGVQALLNDKEWSEWSDRAIARQCGVSHTLVAHIRAESCEGLAPSTVTVKRGKQTYKAKKPKAKKAKAKAKRLDQTTEAKLEKKPNEQFDYEVFAKALGHEPSETITKTVLGLTITCHGLLGKPEECAKHLMDNGIRVEPNMLVNLAKWYESLAFALNEQG